MFFDAVSIAIFVVRDSWFVRVSVRSQQVATLPLMKVGKQVCNCFLT